ncbi:MAG: hypothetical protein R3324_04020 [Halobacteriales archaeon]|nr:hypothetical protein [Halobacteriales archaeon]
MTSREYVLWGVIGGLSFLVLIQGYELIAGDRIDLTLKLGLAGVVLFASTAATAAVGRRMSRRNESA